MIVDKEIVRKRFEKSRDNYNKHAFVQRRICREITDCMEANRIALDGLLLEVGCGSGLLSAEILKKAVPEHYYLNDLVTEKECGITQVLDQYRFLNRTFLEGDAEIIGFPQQLDAIVSTSAVQWFSNLPAFILKVWRALRPGGIFAFSTFGPENFQEIRSACSQGLFYYTSEEINEMMAGGFDVLCVHDEIIPLHFNRPVDVLRHIKNTGVNGLVKPSGWGRQKLQAFEKNYPVSPQNGCLLTYHPIIILARKKNE